MAHLDLQTGTYAAADTLLGSRSERRIGHNTRLHRPYSSAVPAPIAVRYHATDIVTLSADGWLTVSTGGWHTVTTLQRINALLPGRWRIGSHGKHGSYLWHGGYPITPFVDGLQVNTSTGAVGIGGDVLLTADDVAAIETAAEAAEAARADRRAARLLREHPTAGGPRTHTRSLYDQRARGCGRCDTELAAIREARRIALGVEHITGHPADYWGKVTCPWDCPERPNAYR